MYIVDFFKRLGRKSNIPIIIYLILNVLFIGVIISTLFSAPFWLSLLIGVGLYLVSLVVALSPIGEWILRLQTGCKKIKREEHKKFLEPLFKEVYEKAKKEDPTIPDDVSLYINDEEAPNAFATGRKTVCVTKGLLSMPEDQIKATLAHEFGHLAHKDTDLILVVSVGNLIVNAFIIFIKCIVEIIHWFFLLISIFAGGKEGFVTGLATIIYKFLMTALVSGLMWVWTKIGTLLVMKSSRENEFEADAFAHSLGYGLALCGLLDNIGDAKVSGLFANLSSSHPDKDARIGKLQSLGVEYSSI